jgi:hypothetical protein
MAGHDIAIATKDVKTKFFSFSFPFFCLIKQNRHRNDCQGVKKIISLNNLRGLYAYALLYSHGPRQKSGDFLQNKKRIRALFFITLP